MSDRPRRVAFLWKQMATSWTACFQALAAEGVDVHLTYRQPHPHAPYDRRLLDGGFPGHCWDGEPDVDRISKEMDKFQPDVLLVAGWDVGAYRRIARQWRGRTLRILAMDNQWLATVKQRGGVLISPFVIRPAFDAAFLPGERQAVFARRLGFADERILWGVYACDVAAYAAVNGSRRERARSFLFVGRLSPEKGIDVLVEAYHQYRDGASDPWPLIVCGTGPMADRLAKVAGMDLRGFVQPSDLPKVFGEAACLVLPSLFEPWGVVVHEATAAGLPVICTTAVGASSRLVLDGYNGAILAAGDARAMSIAMDDMANAHQTLLAEMGKRSTELARQYTPERWAQYLLDRSGKLRVAMGFHAR